MAARQVLAQQATRSALHRPRVAIAAAQTTGRSTNQAQAPPAVLPVAEQLEPEIAIQPHLINDAYQLIFVPEESVRPLDAVTQANPIAELTQSIAREMAQRPDMQREVQTALARRGIRIDGSVDMIDMQRILALTADVQAMGGARNTAFLALINSVIRRFSGRCVYGTVLLSEPVL